MALVRKALVITQPSQRFWVGHVAESMAVVGAAGLVLGSTGGQNCAIVHRQACSLFPLWDTSSQGDISWCTFVLGYGSVDVHE